MIWQYSISSEEQLKIREDRRKRTKVCSKCGRKFLSKDNECICLECTE